MAIPHEVGWDTGQVLPFYIRFNTKHAESPGGDWYWRVGVSLRGVWFETLARSVTVARGVGLHTSVDDIPGVGVKYQLSGVGTIQVTESGTLHVH